MIRYSVQPRDRKIVKGYGFLSFAKNMDKIISKSFSGKYSQKLLDYAEKSATDALKAFSKKAIQKTAEATGDLIGNKIVIKLLGFQKMYIRTIQKQSQIIMIKKYLNKDMCLQKTGKKLKQYNDRVQWYSIIIQTVIND